MCSWKGSAVPAAGCQQGRKCLCVHGLLLRCAQPSKAIAVSYWSRKLVPWCVTICVFVGCVPWDFECQLVLLLWFFVLKKRIVEIRFR